MTQPPIIDVIIPAFNEEAAIGSVVRHIPKGIVRDIIVCNNNSTDNTSISASDAGAEVILEPSMGYGNACLKGINHIKQKRKELPPDIVVFMDADFSDHPEEIPKLVKPIIEGKDLVIGSRVMGNLMPGALTPVQKFGNWLATKLIRVFYGFRFTDLGPFRAIRWPRLLELDMRDRNFGWTVEMQVKALKHNLACAEVPVSYRKRIGTSKISGTVKGSLLAGHKIIWTILKWL